jgi:predicted secreted protein
MVFAYRGMSDPRHQQQWESHVNNKYALEKGLKPKQPRRRLRLPESFSLCFRSCATDEPVCRTAQAAWGRLA